MSRAGWKAAVALAEGDVYDPLLAHPDGTTAWLTVECVEQRGDDVHIWHDGDDPFDEDAAAVYDSWAYLRLRPDTDTEEK